MDNGLEAGPMDLGYLFGVISKNIKVNGIKGWSMEMVKIFTRMETDIKDNLGLGWQMDLEGIIGKMAINLLVILFLERNLAMEYGKDLS